MLTGSRMSAIVLGKLARFRYSYRSVDQILTDNEKLYFTYVAKRCAVINKRASVISRSNTFSLGSKRWGRSSRAHNSESRFSLAIFKVFIIVRFFSRKRFVCRATRRPSRMIIWLWLFIWQDVTLRCLIVKMLALSVSTFSALAAREPVFNAVNTIRIDTVSIKTSVKRFMVCIESAARSIPSICIRSCTLAQNRSNSLIANVLDYASVRGSGWRYCINFFFDVGYSLYRCSENRQKMTARYFGWWYRHACSDSLNQLEWFPMWVELGQQGEEAGLVVSDRFICTNLTVDKILEITKQPN